MRVWARTVDQSLILAELQHLNQLQRSQSSSRDASFEKRMKQRRDCLTKNVAVGFLMLYTRASGAGQGSIV